MEKKNRQVHGGDIYRNPHVTDFSVNSNPLGVPESALRAVQNNAENIVHYPDMWCSKLREAIGGFEHTDMDHILCGNGAAELFFAAVLAIRPKRALVTAPAFSEYERALRVVNAEVDYCILKKEDAFQVKDEILKMITPQTDMVFLCNPNNPTGQVTEKNLILKVLKKCRECGAILLLDECFLDFLETPEMYESKEYLEQYPELLIVKAFTKIFCMPGIRLGYAISANHQLLHSMAEMLQPWNVSVLAQVAGKAVLQDCEQYIEQTRKYVGDQKTWMIRELRKMGYEVYGSRANYIFFSGRPGLYEAALDAGFLIRDCQNYEGLDSGYYRIAVRTQEENERLIVWLRKL